MKDVLMTVAALFITVGAYAQQVGGGSLAGAAAEAAKVKHDWPTSTNLGTPATTADKDVKKSKDDDPPPPPKGALDQQREAAAKMFAPQIDFIRQMQDQFHGADARYKAACLGKKTIATHPVVGPFGIIYNVPTVTANETTPECRGMLSDMERFAASVVLTANDIREAGRKQGFYPGIMRELLGPFIKNP
ncbi:MAG TPA: hypothetical protein VEU08_17260 [Vicinamibacterales bacterium]|nr:hypothetical protein [Vicinamibacterales bacterium]